MTGSYPLWYVWPGSSSGDATLANQQLILAAIAALGAGASTWSEAEKDAAILALTQLIANTTPEPYVCG